MSDLDHVTIVLNQPQDPVNIGGVVRAMKNMGLARLHLVEPQGFDPYRIEGVAHTGMDIIRSARVFDDLAGAVAGARLVMGSSARGRRARRTYVRPWEAASQMLGAARRGEEVAVVFGREDRGLSNEDLDLCSRVVVIPTDPEHSSLNLAQAVLVVAYELARAAEIGGRLKEPRRSASRATRSQIEELAVEIQRSLEAVDFFKAHKVTAIMRTVREVIGRADLDERETALFKAMAYEVRNFLRRHGFGARPRERGS